VIVHNVPDTSPPDVFISNPSENDVVSGSITVGADALDDVVVAKIAFYACDILLKEDSIAPYETLWDTTTVLNGNRTLTVKAIDKSGNENTKSIMVHVNNLSDTSGPELFFITPKDGQNISGKIEIEIYAEESIGGAQCRVVR
jgi:hypothetical protein